jgi:hypothetical protein
MEQGGSLLAQRLARQLAARVRLSAPRRNVIEALAASPGQAWTAEALQAACNLRQPGAISRASSYRTLTLLEGLGLLESCPEAGGRAWRLSAASLGEIELADPALPARTCPLPADKWLRRYVQQLATRHGLELTGFELRLEGRFARPVRRKAGRDNPTPA